MSDSVEFSISNDTYDKMLKLKNEKGFRDSKWDDWFNHLLKLNENKEDQLEHIMKKIYYDKFYEDWVKNFALNLNDIWHEHSARNLRPHDGFEFENHAAIVIGRGPSIRKKNHLELIAKSNYRGAIVCCDGALINALKAGITPDKFPNYFVVTIDTAPIIRKYYDDEIVNKYGSKIKGVFSTVVDPSTVQRARQAGIAIHWLHALFDFNEGKKSFNQISALMVKSKKHTNGLPGIQTGGNVGTASWFVSWQILRCSVVGLIGINHSWDEDDPWELIMSHCNMSEKIDRNHPAFEQLFPRVFNPNFNCYCILDPIFVYYSRALKEFISRSPSWVNTINATEGGSIFGDRITHSTLKDFIKKYEN